MKDIWHNVYFGNNLIEWLTAAGIFLGGCIALRLIKSQFLMYLKKWSKKTNTSLDDFLVNIAEKSAIPYGYFLSLYTGLHWLDLSMRTDLVINKALLLVSAFFVLRTINTAVQYFLFSFLNTQENGDAKKRQARGILVIIKALVWIMGIVFLMDNLGYNISTIIAGLGIGGIAIALAAQTILGDLFSYFVILFDRPFEIGDFIAIDDKMGVVENIGIKTTRLRNLAGEQLICSNKDLTDSRIHNYKRMEKRRVVFKLGITYQTPPDLLEEVPAMVKEIIIDKADVIFDRAHFAGLGDFSLNFEIVYFIMSADYNLFMDRQQAINYEIFRAFESKEIDFAFPTQTLFINAEKEMAN